MSRNITAHQIRDVVLRQVKELGYEVQCSTLQGEITFTVLSDAKPPFDKREVIIHPKCFERLAESIAPGLATFEYRHCDAQVKSEIDRLVEYIVGPMRHHTPQLTSASPGVSARRD